MWYFTSVKQYLTWDGIAVWMKLTSIPNASLKTRKRFNTGLNTRGKVMEFWTTPFVRQLRGYRLHLIFARTVYNVFTSPTQTFLQSSRSWVHSIRVVWGYLTRLAWRGSGERYGWIICFHLWVFFTTVTVTLLHRHICVDFFVWTEGFRHERDKKSRRGFLRQRS